MSQAQTKPFTVFETAAIASDLEQAIIDQLKSHGVNVTGYKLRAIEAAVQMLTRDVTRKI